MNYATNLKAGSGTTTGGGNPGTPPGNNPPDTGP